MIPGHVALLLPRGAPDGVSGSPAALNLFLEATQLDELMAMSLVRRLNATSSHRVARRRDDSEGVLEVLSGQGRATEEGEVELSGDRLSSFRVRVESTHPSSVSFSSEGCFSEEEEEKKSRTILFRVYFLKDEKVC